MSFLGGLASGLVGGIVNLIGGQQQNKANQNIANAQMAFQQGQTEQQMDFGREMVARQEDFQRQSTSTAMGFAENMANTSYQRGMADMKAAGLNPILAYKQGGATSPAGSTASGATASVSAMPGATARMENVLGPAMQSALGTMQSLAQLEAIAAGVQKTEAETAVAKASVGNINASTARTIEQTGTEPHHRRFVKMQPALAEAQSAAALGAAEASRASAGNIREETSQMQRYGRNNWIGGPLGTLEQIWNRIFSGQRMSQGGPAPVPFEHTVTAP